MEADFTFLVMAFFLAATFRRALEALRLNLLMALARLLPPLRAEDFLPRFAAPREDFFADRFALAAITAPFGLKCASVLANSRLFRSNTMNPATGFISSHCRAVKCQRTGGFFDGTATAGQACVGSAGGGGGAARRPEADLLRHADRPRRMCRCRLGRCASHCVLYMDEDQWVIQDNGSSTGTYVNGREISGPVYLNFGDVVRLGSRRWAGH